MTGSALHVVLPEHGIEFDIGPAFADLNTFYHAAAMVYIKPHSLAHSLGRISDERYTEMLASCYAEGVIFQTEPKMGTKAVKAWLLAHPAEFTMIRSYAEHRSNFEDGDGEHQSAGQTSP